MSSKLSVVRIFGVGVVVTTATVVGHVISSSGQSWTPLHHKVVLIQMLLVGHKIVFSGHGWHVHLQVDVTVLLSPFSQFSHCLGIQWVTPPILQRHSEQSSFLNEVPTGYEMCPTKQGHSVLETQFSPSHHLSGLHLHAWSSRGSVVTPGQ